jgi:hypothetical protein
MASRRKALKAVAGLLHRLHKNSIIQLRDRIMTPDDFVVTVLDPGLSLLKRVSGIWSDDRARVLLVAIAGQESGMKSRRQSPGPARGWFQFEEAGGVAGVLKNPLTSAPAQNICAQLDIPPDVATVYEAIAWSDALSVAFARLLVWSDPAELPVVGERDRAWQYYIRNWRPGRARPESWSDRYAVAVETIKSHPLESPIT